MKEGDRGPFFPKLRVRIKDNNTSLHGKFRRFLFPFSSKFADQNFTSYVLYIFPCGTRSEPGLPVIITVSVCKQQHICSFRCCKCHFRCFLQLDPNPELLKGEKVNIKQPFWFLEKFVFLLSWHSNGESWQDILHICWEFIPKLWHGLTFINYNECDMTQLFSRESLFHNMFCNFLSKRSSAFFRKQNCISLLQSVEAHCPLMTKWWKES